MNFTDNYILFFVCIFGLCLGSFYNVVILRSLSNESIIFPPSKCPKCNNKLLWWHNIPILSYILLKGKCYFCHEKISIQYPIIEFVTMVIFGFTYIKIGLCIKSLFIVVWLSLLLIMTVTDLKEKIVDCNLAIAMAVLGVIYNGIIFGGKGVFYSALGLIAGAVIIELVARLGFLVAKTRAMGEADTYVAGALGAVFGITKIVPVLFTGLVASMIFIVPVFLYNRFKSYDIQTCVLSLCFGISVGMYLHLATMIAYVLLVISGILLTYTIIKSIGKTKEENRIILPYVPALAIGALFWIF